MSGDIPVLKTAERAYINAFKDLPVIFLAAWKPWLGSFVLGGVVGFIEGFLGTQSALGQALIALIGVIFGAYFALAMHRYYLSGRAPVAGKVRFTFHRAERVFLTFVTIYWLIYVVLPLIVTQTQNGILVGALLPIIILSIPAFVWSSLILPAAAAGQNAPFSFGWRLARDNRVRLLVVLILTSLPITIGSRLFARVMADYPFTAEIISSIIAYPLSAISIAAVCAAYEIRLTTAPEAPAPESV